MVLNIVLQILVLIGLVLTYQWMFTDMTVLEAKAYLFGSTAVAIILSAIAVYQFSALRKRVHVRKAEEAEKYVLEYSHELFSELYRSSPVPYVVINGEGLIESINFSCARLFDVSLNTLDGQNVFPFFEGEDENKVALIPEYFKQGKFVNNVEILIRRPDGVTRWVLVSLFSFKDAHGKRKGLLTLVDVTKQKMIDKAKTEFVSLASHQLRTPISGMKWNIELLLGKESAGLGEVARAYIEKIAHSLMHMDVLVDDFLSASKFELGTLTPTYAPVPVVPFLSGIQDELSAFAEQKNIRIEPLLSEATIQSDTHLLHMISSNLLSNAIKYTPVGGTVRMSATVEDDTFTLMIADTGIGIPLDDQDEIFTKMFRASNTRTYGAEGTGLGLYIVHEAVKILKGTITFVSKESEGTTFTVTLPKG